MGDAYKEALKERLSQGLDGRPLTWLESQTGDSYKNVQRWVSGDTMPPADFLMRYLEATRRAARWLLMGEGPEFEREPTVYQEAYEEVEAVVLRVRGTIGGGEPTSRAEGDQATGKMVEDVERERGAGQEGREAG